MKRETFTKVEEPSIQAGNLHKNRQSLKKGEKPAVLNAVNLQKRREIYTTYRREIFPKGVKPSLKTGKLHKNAGNLH